MEALPAGTLDLLVLSVLRKGAMHGYAIVSRLKETSEEVLAVEEGTMYPALHRMERKGWLESEWRKNDTGRRARFYSLTAEGKARLLKAKKHWKARTKAVGRVLGVDLA